MTDEESLRQAFVSVEVNGDFTQATLLMSDGSKLCFRHRVGERSACVDAQSPLEVGQTLAAQLLARIAMFRLNAKHLDILFHDGSRWEAAFPGDS